MADKLRDYSITQSHIKKIYDEKLQAERNGQAAVKYLRFAARARIEKIEVPVQVYGRMVPAVPVHPAGLEISVMDENTFQWRTVKQVSMPYDPDIAGENLNQDMSIDDMEAHFARILNKPACIIDLDNLETDHLRIECAKEHPSWPNHGEMNGGVYNIAFGALDKVGACGELLEDRTLQTHRELLKSNVVDFLSDGALRSYKILSNVYFESDKLKIGFSLRRPLICFLGWDYTNRKKHQTNRLVYEKTQMSRLMDCYGQKMLSGPLLSTVRKDCGALQWAGEVEVKGNTVCYKNLTSEIEGYTLQATFTINPGGFSLELEETCTRDLPVLEYEPWRLSFDQSIAMTAVATAPMTSPGRNGAVELPVLWAGDDCGCLCGTWQGADTPESYIQVDSSREKNNMTSGFVTLNRQGSGGCIVIPKGRRRNVFDMTVTNILPAGAIDLADPALAAVCGLENKKLALAYHWQSVYSCFRPEHGGFSNNAVSVNCHVNQMAPMEVSVFTRQHESGVSAFKMYQYTIERAIMGGGGYGYYRDLFFDSDPILLCGAARIFEYQRDKAWLIKIRNGITSAIDRMASSFGKEGLMVCRSLSGNSGSYRWSSNAMDVVGFGHIDAYSNAWAYRAFKNGTALMKALQDENRARLCSELAGRIKENYAAELLNPQTGWIAGWKSRDGMLHDYAFIFVNAPALAFGLLDRQQTVTALGNLEKLRNNLGIDSFEYGIPFNFQSIAAADHMLPYNIIKDLSPTFERYTDGSMGAGNIEYYLRALSTNGFAKEASKLAADYCQGLLGDNFTAGVGVGKEFHSWEGVPIGYEGTFVASFTPLYAVAVELGIIKPRDPEWWIEE